MKVIVTTSSLPISDNDKVPAFVKDQVIELKKTHKKSEYIILAPHNAYSKTASRLTTNKYYDEKRFHYFWPHRWELLAGRGIMPALQQNALLYIEVPFFLLFQSIALLRLVIKEKPDLIYAHWFMPQALVAVFVSILTNTPFMFTTHASDVSVVRKKIPFSAPVIRWICTKAAAYTAVSERTAEKLRNSIKPRNWDKTYSGKLSIIPMGVNTQATKVNQKFINKTIEKYKLPPKKQYLMFIGRLAEKKGVRYLIDAVAHLDKINSDKLHVIVAGDGQLLDNLRDQAQKQRVANITFTGYIHGTDKDALMQIADMMCFPSIVDSQADSEGFPVAIMESLAAGKVVLASNVSGGETIISNRSDGFIFKQKSTDSLMKTIISALKLTEQQKKSMQTGSKELAKQFKWEGIAKKHYAIFEKIIHTN